jgi:DNA-binding response OmpR family regulator
MVRVSVVVTNDGTRGSLATALQRHGYEVIARSTGMAVERIIESQPPDLVIVGLRAGTAAIDDLAVGRQVRAVSSIPLLFVADDNGLEDRIAAFDLGADDVISAPYAMAEFLARVRALVRRGRQGTRRTLVLDDVVVDELAHTVECAGHLVGLTAIEFSLLVTLLRHPGHVLSKVQLLDDVWGFDHYDVNLVEVHISALRRKLEDHGPRIVQTVRGAGYVARSSRLAHVATGPSGGREAGRQDRVRTKARAAS